MFLPARLAYALRPNAAPGLLAAAAATAVMFGATPFLIPELARHFGVSEGFAGGVSVAQVAAFALANVVAPRLVSPSRRLLTGAGAGLVAANLASAAAPSFAVLLAFRAVAGACAGTLTWIAWIDAMRHRHSMAAVAAVGPVTALIAAPLLSLVAELGDRAVYLALAAAAVPTLMLGAEIEAGAPPDRRVSRSRSNRVLLAALFLQVFAGSALFIYTAVAAREELGLTPVATSFGFSLNALGGLIGARLSTRHRRPGWWLASSGLGAFLTVGGGHVVLFYAGLLWWGFAFWMGIPGVLTMMAERSLEPGERAGDAQAVMAFGRAVGPLLGGGLADAGAFRELALIVGAGMTASGLVVTGVQEGRRLLPPSDSSFGPPPGDGLSAPA
jgi:predicted MFS family arabinose efflux permease